MRLLRNNKSGVILPWNPHMAKHPNMEPYEAPGEPVMAPKPAPRKTRKRAPKRAIPANTDVELDDLMAGIENGTTAQ